MSINTEKAISNLIQIKLEEFVQQFLFSLNSKYLMSSYLAVYSTLDEIYFEEFLEISAHMYQWLVKNDRINTFCLVGAQ